LVFIFGIEELLLMTWHRVTFSMKALV